MSNGFESNFCIHCYQRTDLDDPKALAAICKQFGTPGAYDKVPLFHRATDLLVGFKNNSQGKLNLRRVNQIIDAVNALPSSYKNCTVENYEQEMAKIKGLLNALLEVSE